MTEVDLSVLNEKQFRERFSDFNVLKNSVKDTKFEDLFIVALSFGSILEKELISGLKDNQPSEASQFRLAELYSKYEALVSSLLMTLEDEAVSSKKQDAYDDIYKFTNLLFEQAFVSLSKAESIEKSSNKSCFTQIIKAKESIFKLQKEFTT